MSASRSSRRPARNARSARATGREPGRRGRRAAGKNRLKALEVTDPQRVVRGDRRRLQRCEKRQAAAILSVHLPSLAARRQRLQTWGRRLVSAGVGLVLILLTVGVTRLWLRHGVVHSEHFQLADMEVVSDGWRDAAWVRETLGLGPATPLLDLDLAEARQRLEAEAGVVRARLQRELPNRLRVEIQERHPVAWLEAPALGLRPLSATDGLLLDAQGFGWRPRHLRPEWADLPVVSSARLDQLPDNGQLEERSLRQSLELIALLNTQPGLEPGLLPQQLRLIEERGGRPAFRIEATTRARQRLLFSLDPLLSGSLAEQCQRLVKVSEGLAKRGETLERLNLCQRRQLAVVLRGGEGSVLREVAAEADLPLQQTLDLAALEAVEGQEAAEADYSEALAQVPPAAGQPLADTLAAAMGAGSRSDSSEQNTVDSPSTMTAGGSGVAGESNPEIANDETGNGLVATGGLADSAAEIDASSAEGGANDDGGPVLAGAVTAAPARARFQEDLRSILLLPDSNP